MSLLYRIYRLRHALIDPEVIKVKGQGHALPVCVCKGGNLGGSGGPSPQLLGWGYSYLYLPTIPEVSGDVVVTVG